MLRRSQRQGYDEGHPQIQCVHQDLADQPQQHAHHMGMSPSILITSLLHDLSTVDPVCTLSPEQATRAHHLGTSSSMSATRSLYQMSTVVGHGSAPSAAARRKFAMATFCDHTGISGCLGGGTIGQAPRYGMQVMTKGCIWCEYRVVSCAERRQV